MNPTFRLYVFIFSNKPKVMSVIDVRKELHTPIPHHPLPSVRPK